MNRTSFLRKWKELEKDEKHTSSLCMQKMMFHFMRHLMHTLILTRKNFIEIAYFLSRDFIMSWKITHILRDLKKRWKSNWMHLFWGKHDRKFHILMLLRQTKRSFLLSESTNTSTMIKNICWNTSRLAVE